MPTDIPSHFKTYRLFMYCPRAVGTVSFRGALRTETGVYEFGKVPAASGMHAINTYWETCPHQGPSMLDVDGNPLRLRKIKKGEMRAEECQPDNPPGAAIE